MRALCGGARTESVQSPNVLRAELCWWVGLGVEVQGVRFRAAMIEGVRFAVLQGYLANEKQDPP